MRTLIKAVSADTIVEAATLLQRGELVAFATETVYGLGGDALNDRAVARIFAAKGRPSFNPLIAHADSLAMAERYGHFSPLARQLAQVFWPGPLTLIVPAKAEISLLARAGLESIALRVPRQASAIRLIQAFGQPIAAPSANRSGHVSPVTAQHVFDDLSGRISLILDDGPAEVGLESTIVATLRDDLILLRSGAISAEDIARVCGIIPRNGAAIIEQNAPVAPGQLASHYAPCALVRLNALTVGEGETGLDFHAQLSDAGFGTAFDLSRQGSLEEAAAHLFCALRKLDQSGATMIAIAPIPDIGIGQAINDRLRRASAPR